MSNSSVALPLELDRTALEWSTGLAGVAVLAYLARYVTLQSGLQTDIVVVIESLFVSVLPPLLAAVGAFSVLTTAESAVTSVVAGFTLGGFLYGTGLLAVQWVLIWRTVAGFRLILPSHLVLVAVFVVMVLLGALGGVLQSHYT